MNIPKQYIIPHKSLANGKHEFVFKADDDFFRSFEGSGLRGGRADISVTMTKSASSLLLEIKIGGTVTVECDRCLDDLQLSIDYAGKLKIKFSDEITEYDGETMWVHPSDDSIELAQYIYESIVLGLPYVRAHGNDENGESLCDKDMLARFSIITQEELDEMDVETVSLEDSPEGEKLKELKEKLGQ